MIIQKEEAVFTYNLFSLFIKILIYFTFVVANIRIKPIPSKFFPVFFSKTEPHPLFLTVQIHEKYRYLPIFSLFLSSHGRKLTGLDASRERRKREDGM